MLQQSETLKNVRLLSGLTTRERNALYLVIFLLIWGLCVRTWRTHQAKAKHPTPQAATAEPAR